MGWLAGETLIGARLDVSSHCVSARCGNLSAAQISRGRAALIPGRQFVSFLTLLESARLHHSVGTLIMQIYTESIRAMICVTSHLPESNLTRVRDIEPVYIAATS